jgi:hypothetical protein
VRRDRNRRAVFVATHRAFAPVLSYELRYPWPFLPEQFRIRRSVRKKVAISPLKQFGIKSRDDNHRLMSLNQQVELFLIVR